MIQHANPGELAAGVIVGRARAITAAEEPNNVDVVRHRLESELGTVRPDTSGVVEAWAKQIELTLTEADRERLRRHSDVSKDEALWERERDHERHKRDYLSEVLTNPSSAVTWWLARKNNDVEDTVRLLDALAQLCAVANHKGVPELVPNGSFSAGSRQITWFPPAGLAAGPFSDARPVVSRVGALMDTLDIVDDSRALFAHYLAQLIEQFGKPDQAQEIQRRFNAPATDQEPAGHTKQDGDSPDEPAPDGEQPWQEEP